MSGIEIVGVFAAAPTLAEAIYKGYHKVRELIGTYRELGTHIASLESDICDSTHDVDQVRAIVSQIPPQTARELSNNNPDLLPNIDKDLQACSDATRDLHQLLAEVIGKGHLFGSKRAKALVSLRLRLRRRRLNESQQRFKAARARVSQALQLVHLGVFLLRQPLTRMPCPESTPTPPLIQAIPFNATRNSSNRYTPHLTLVHQPTTARSITTQGTQATKDLPIETQKTRFANRPSDLGLEQRRDKYPPSVFVTTNVDNKSLPILPSLQLQTNHLEHLLIAIRAHKAHHQPSAGTALPDLPGPSIFCRQPRSRPPTTSNSGGAALEEDGGRAPQYSVQNWRQYPHIIFALRFAAWFWALTLMATFED